MDWSEEQLPWFATKVKQWACGSVAGRQHKLAGWGGGDWGMHGRCPGTYDKPAVCHGSGVAQRSTTQHSSPPCSAVPAAPRLWRAAGTAAAAAGACGVAALRLALPPPPPPAQQGMQGGGSAQAVATASTGEQSLAGAACARSRGAAAVHDGAAEAVECAAALAGLQTPWPVAAGLLFIAGGVLHPPVHPTSPLTHSPANAAAANKWRCPPAPPTKPSHTTPRHGPHPQTPAAQHCPALRLAITLSLPRWHLDFECVAALAQPVSQALARHLGPSRQRHPLLVHSLCVRLQEGRAGGWAGGGNGGGRGQVGMCMCRWFTVSAGGGKERRVCTSRG